MRKGVNKIDYIFIGFLLYGSSGDTMRMLGYRVTENSRSLPNSKREKVYGATDVGKEQCTLQTSDLEHDKMESTHLGFTQNSLLLQPSCSSPVGRMRPWLWGPSSGVST